MERTWRRWRRPARELLRAVTDLLLPPACPACGDPSDGLCPVCRQNLQLRVPPGCARCGETVLGAGDVCGSDHRELRNVARLVAPIRYCGTGGALVRRFKLDGDPAAARWLVRVMSASWAPLAHGEWRRAVLVSVPLHRARRRERGFDQAEWLARAIAARLGLPMAAGVMVRRRATLPQGDPRVLSRANNVDGAFVVENPRLVVGRRVVLVDDVFTSGATARSCALALRTAGALEVAALMACRS